MDGTEIYIKNKLEVKDGSPPMIQVPSMEPISSLSSLALSRYIGKGNSMLPVDVVLKLIPGSHLVKVFVPQGQISTGWFLELPAGPPRNGNKCPANCLEDWYAILRAYVSKTPQTTVPECASTYDISGCLNELDDIRTPRDPEMRPNSKPLETPFPMDGPNNIGLIHN